jgi:hypothetical protein
MSKGNLAEDCQAVGIGLENPQPAKENLGHDLSCALGMFRRRGFGKESPT